MFRIQNWAMVAEGTCWACVAYGVWLLTLSSITASDAIVAGCCAVPVAVASVGARRALGDQWRVRPSWLRWLGPVAAAAVLDSVRLCLVALRHDRAAQQGAFSRTLIPVTESDRVAASHLGLATLALSATAGSCVIDSDPQKRMLRMHTLIHGWPHADKVVPS